MIRGERKKYEPNLSSIKFQLLKTGLRRKFTMRIWNQSIGIIL